MAVRTQESFAEDFVLDLSWLGFQIGSWRSRGLPETLTFAVEEAEALGFGSVWTSESYGSDAFTPLAWLAGLTKRLRLCAGVAVLAARSPATTAMTALTLDHLSEGRLLLGLGVSGRAVVERWHGTPFHPPIRWTREYIALVRALVAGRPAHNIYPLPDAVDSPGGSSADRGLRTYLPARRQEIPIYLAAQGPKNLALAAEYCEGAIIAYFDPAAADWYAAAIAIGLERRQRSTDFKMVAMPFVEVGSDVEAAAATVKPRLAFYLARMGSPGANYYANALGRLGFGEVCQKIVALYDSGETDLAARQVPTEMVEAVACVGPIDTVCARLKSFRAAGADTVVCRGTVDSLRQLAVALRGSG